MMKQTKLIQIYNFKLRINHKNFNSIDCGLLVLSIPTFLELTLHSEKLF